MHLTDPIALTQALIRCPSVTPETAGSVALVSGWLEKLGFTCHAERFSDEGTAPVDNLYARLGTSGPNFCFAGHLDVVPVGDAAAWSHPPFAAEIAGESLIGRGVCDMKGAIAAFIAAVARLREKGAVFPGSISLLLTLDEEGPATLGTRKMLEWMQARGERMDACLVGEPTSDRVFGDTVKIGRRGSLNCVLTSVGRQGHVAYPDLAENPVTPLVRFLAALKAERLDEGTEFFPPSNLEITSVDVGNPTHNIIPSTASARLNIRFNALHTGNAQQAWLLQKAAEISPNLQLTFALSGESFLTPPGALSGVVTDAVQRVTGILPALSTTGGTSDARFIKDHCPVVEFGLRNATAHKVDEQVPVAEIEALAQVYEQVLIGYFR